MLKLYKHILDIIIVFNERERERAIFTILLSPAVQGKHNEKSEK